MSDRISIRGAKTHNLKNIDIDIPKNSLVVITGVSWSGKSSLAFDTIYAEGQRRYLESLSTYARMIISSINDDTKVDEIRGLSPTIAIHQKTVSTNPRSTVGTITEIYDYFRLLYSTIGIQKCPNHPDVELKKTTVSDIVKDVEAFSDGEKFHILSPLEHGVRGGTLEWLGKTVLDKWFVRYQVWDLVFSVGETPPEKIIADDEAVDIVIDRLSKKNDPEFFVRLRDSLQAAYSAGNGRLSLYRLGDWKRVSYHENASCPECGYELRDLSLSNFSFNSHFWACESCHGLWTEVTFLEEKVINFDLTLAEWAVLPWSGHPYYSKILDEMSKRFGVPMNVPYAALSSEHKEKVLYGTPGEHYEITPDWKYWDGIKTYKTKYEWVIPTLTRRYRETDPGDVFMKKISQYVTEIPCPKCDGYRLKPEYLSIYIGGLHIGQLSDLSVSEAIEFFQKIVFPSQQSKIVEPILKNIRERLDFLCWVGLSYMTLSRKAQTLSGGESQRIRLATQIGTRLEWIIYVLDEPSIGLHPRDNDMLIRNMRRLVELGNTVLVVEHDEDVMLSADWIIDIGPKAGVHGGEVIFQWTKDEILASSESDTGAYLSGRKCVHVQKTDRTPQWTIEIIGARENNLKNIDVSIPIGMMTVVTGVSGSGKSSLIIDILANSVTRFFGNNSDEPGKHKKIVGLDQLDKSIIIDQSPIGRTPHSNIATYTGLFTFVREVFAGSLEAQKRWFGPGRFSFNTRGWRCEVCEWTGVKKIEMHFLPDVFVECESCGWSRYNQETLEVRFKGKTIADVLDMTCEDALDFFAAFPRISRILQVLVDVGLWYIKLGQSAPTLSGGEAQRIKLAFDLSKRSTSKTLYILDEPTTGLHFSDVQKLLEILERLVQKWNTIVIIEHNLDIIANADYIIDIGPEWGNAWWNLVYAGPTESILKIKNSYTTEALKRYLSAHNIHGTSKK